MPVDFHGDMDKYLSGKRRKRLFSDIKFKIMNRKAVLSYKTANKLGSLKEKLVLKAGEIRNKNKEIGKKITQNDINELVEQGTGGQFNGQVTFIKKKEEGIREIIPSKVSKVIWNQSKLSQEKKTETSDEDGWKEVKFEKLQRESTLNNLEEEKRKVQESLAKIEGKRESETQKLVKLGEEREQRERAESEEEKAKRLVLEDEVRILKEKQNIESDRLSELRTARRIEQMDALRGRVTDILFNKKPRIKKDMGEVVRREIRTEAKINSTKVLSPISVTQPEDYNASSEIKEVGEQEVGAKEIGQPKEDVTKTDDEPEKVVKSEEFSKEKVEETFKGEIKETLKEEFKETLKEELKEELMEELKETLKEEHKEEIKETSESKKEVSKKEEKPKKSFFSRFIQIRTAEQIAKEEEERLKQEEEQALKEPSNINNIFQGEEGVVSNEPSEEQDINIVSTLFSGEVRSNTSEEEQINDLSTLFPDEGTSEMKAEEDTIELDGDYKIKVVRN